MDILQRLGEVEQERRFVGGKSLPPLYTGAGGAESGIEGSAYAVHIRDATCTLCIWHLSPSFYSPS